MTSYGDNGPPSLFGRPIGIGFGKGGDTDEVFIVDEMLRNAQNAGGDPTANDEELQQKQKEIAQGPMLGELKYLEKRYTDKGQSYIVEHVKEEIPDQSTQWYEMYALVVTYDMERSGKNRYVQQKLLQVNSKHLKDLLKDVIQNFPGQSFNTATISIPLPAKSLFHYRKDIKEEGLKRFEGNDEASDHLKLLLNFVDQEFEETIRESENLVEQNLINYKFLWTIFRPGTTVFSYSLGQPRIWRAVNYQYICNRLNTFDVTVSFIDFDGEQFGTRTWNLSIPEFEGVEPIADLNVCPLSYHPSPEQVAQQLVARGKAFESLAGQNLRTYTGIALDECDRFNIQNSRVIIDCKTFHRLNANQAFSVCPLRSAETKELQRRLALAKLDSELVSKKENILVSLTDEERMMASATVRGFSFTDRQWFDFFVENLSPIEWSPHSFQDLVLPEAQKDTVRALVSQHTHQSGSNDFDDIVKGKGKGLVFALHGPPGIGKTLTAECVAEYVQRPLYIVSSGDLGTDARELDTRLSRILDMAATFRAILLLDEADVFLEERSLHDLQRNALVSIFLRVLEYYQGILFMTTNRIKTFDDAFKSRIHVPLKYDDLDKASRKRIWQNFLEKGDSGTAIDDNGYDKLAQRDLNGRQIKNVIRTAKSLANFRDGRLTLEALEQVVDIQEAFGFDLNNLNGNKGMVNGVH